MIKRNQWESDFFGRRIGHLAFDDGAVNFENALDFELIQAKIASYDRDKIKFLQQHQFQFIEGEIHFVLPLSPFLPLTCSLDIATLQDIEQLRPLVANAFSHSRFCLPYFSEAEKRAFYQKWIENAVDGKFDDICLVVRDQQNAINGAVSVKIAQKTAHLGLIAVKPTAQGKGIGSALLEASIYWALQRNAKTLSITTQLSNLPAIRLYQKFNAKIENISYWFYKQT